MKIKIKIREKKAVFLILSLLFTVSLFSQQKASISGKIFDAKSKSPLENVGVIISETNQNISSDSKGFFSFEDLSSGKYTLILKYLGYQDANSTINLKAGETKILNFYMDIDVQYLNEVVIEGENIMGDVLSKLPYIETIIVKKQIDENAVRDVGEFMRGSKNIGGVRKGAVGIDPVVRGFKYSQLNIQMDNGLKIEGGCPNRMDPATAHVEIEDLESIEIHKGPYALKYGPSFGGVINMKTVSHDISDTAHIHVNASTGFESNWGGYKGQLSVHGGNKFMFFNLSGGRKDYGNYKDGNGNEVKSEFNRYNYKAKLGFRPAKNQTIVLSYDESHGFDIRFPTLPMDERQDDTRLMSLDYTARNLSGFLNSITAKIYNSDVNHKMDNKNRPFSDTVVAVSDIHAVNQGGRLETGFNIPKGSLTAGVDYENILKDGQRDKNMILQPNLPVKTEKLWNEAVINNTGIFAEYSVNIKTFELVGSARLDFNNANSGDIIIQHPMQGEIYNYSSDSIKSNFTNFSFSLGATKILTKKLSLSLSLGRGVRSPDMTERYIILLPIGYDRFDYLGNPQLEPEANNQIDLTLQFKCEKLGMAQINGFYSLVNNFITGQRLPPAIQKPLTNGVLGVKQFYNAGNARFTGFEFVYSSPAKHKFGGQLFAAYTYGTIDEVKKYVLNDQGNVVDDEILENDAVSEIPPFDATASVHYRFFKGKLIPKINLRMVAAQKHVSEAQYEPTSEGFFLAGISINYNFNEYLFVSGGVNNLFDVAYYEHLNRNIIGSTTNLYEPGRIFYINLMFKI